MGDSGIAGDDLLMLMTVHLHIVGQRQYLGFVTSSGSTREIRYESISTNRRNHDVPNMVSRQLGTSN